MSIESMLVQGQESEKSIDLLISMTKIKSEQVIDALKMHFVAGAQLQMSAEANGLEKSNLSRDVKKINLIAAKINQYFEENYSKMLPVNKVGE